MENSIETAKKLKAFLETIIKRNDLHFSFCEVGPPANPKELNKAKASLPESLLDFYSVMNGCDILASFINNTELSLGLRIPPLERIDGFRYPPKDEYNFPSGYKFIPLEWMEPECAFYYLLADGSDISEAKIVVACPAEEDEFVPVASTMDEFIEKALQSCLTLGWAYKFFGCGRQDEINKIARLLQKPPKPPKPFPEFEPGTRVKVFKYTEQIERGTVVKQVQTEGVHDYYGKDFVLVDFDLKGKHWVPKDEVKKVPRKKDVYETAISDPADFMKKMLDSEPEESARNFHRIGYDDQSYYSFDKIKGLHIPKHSFRYASIFNKLSFEEASSIITELFGKWSSSIKGRIKDSLEFKLDGTEFEKKEHRIFFDYYSVLFTLAGCLAILYILKKKQEPDFTMPTYIQEQLLKHFEKLMESQEFPTNYGSPDHFKETMDSFKVLFQLQRIEESIFSNGRSKWLDELGLDKPFGFRSYK